MLKNLPQQVAPPGQETLYKQIWDYHLWGFTADVIHETLQSIGETISRDEVRTALKNMRDKLENIPYQELTENEFRTYLARNYQAEEELLNLYLQAKSDLELLRSGQTRHPDGSRPMSVDIKLLMSLLTAIEKQGQARVSLLGKISTMTSAGGSTATALPPESEANLLESLTRKPDDEPVDVQFEVE